MAPKKSALRFSMQDRQVLPGSEKAPFLFSPTSKVAPATGKVTVSVAVRRKSPLNTRTLGKVRLTRAEYSRSHAADRADLKLVRDFAKEYGLTVEKDTPKPERRTVLISGTAAAMQKAFGVKLQQVTTDLGKFRVREGSIQIPSELAGVVVAVLGLDNRPQAQPHLRIRKDSLAPSGNQSGGNTGIRPNAASPGTSYTPIQVGQLYQFPAGASATGQTIGIIELGGGYKTADLTVYFKTLGQPAPTITAVSVDGGKNTSDGINGADGEVMLDIEVAAAVAPGAKIVVYFAPNTDQGFIDAIGSAVHDTVNKPSVISISWGGPESSWTQQSLNLLDAACQSGAALGITITVASGDNGSSDGGTGDNVDFPASSPHVLACGGTKLVGSGTTISSEVVWNETASNEGATGGGVSTIFPLPSWQSSANVPTVGGFAGRGVPDVAGDADPTTGYTIRVDGQTIVIGGTSAVAPLWAGLIALSNAQNKTSAGFIQPTIYAAKGKTAFNDITSGNNGTYSAGPGWDACTGLGSPIGTSLIGLLGAGTTPSPKPTPSPTPTPKPTPRPTPTPTPKPKPKPKPPKHGKK